MPSGTDARQVAIRWTDNGMPGGHPRNALAVVIRHDGDRQEANERERRTPGWFGRWEGAVRPQLMWDTERILESDVALEDARD